MRSIDELSSLANVLFPMLRAPLLRQLERQVLGVTVKAAGLLQRVGVPHEAAIKKATFSIYFTIRRLLKSADMCLMRIDNKMS